jgi:hypothetical protein
MSIGHDAIAAPAQARGKDGLKVGSVAALAALSDVLFWNERIGISAALLVAALVVGVVAVNASRIRASNFVQASAIAALAIAPLVETISPLSLSFGAVGVAAFALVVTGQLQSHWPRAVVEPLKLLCLCPFRMLSDVEAILARQGGLLGRIGGLVRWIMPVTLGFVFLALFAAANPMIEIVLSKIDLRELWNAVADGRAVFWIAAAAVTWGLVGVRGVKPLKLRTVGGAAAVSAAPGSGLASQVFGPGAIIRSLLVFNALFALQSAMDIAYLWRGVSLPTSMSYASYAHRGAYPLMITAALAAAFVLRTFGPGSTLEGSRLARGLVFAWIAQNVLLVLSSILRLNLYVDIYALSYWRVAAFIWMGLVACGLVLILLRIAFKRSNVWLVGANMAIAISVLYGCCFVDFAQVIATYNVAHSQEMTKRGVTLDRAYLVSLGPQAIPAIDHAFERLADTSSASSNDWIVNRRNCLAHEAIQSHQNWRAWTWRGARLAAYLERQPLPAPCKH